MIRRHWKGHWIVQTVLLALGLVLMAALGTAAEEEPLKLTLEQFRVVTVDTEEQLVPFAGDEGVPGTIIEYQLTAKNVSETPLGDIILRLWIPEGTVYLDGREQIDRSIALLQFSIDGGESFRSAPIRYIVVREDGTQVQAIATPDMYTDLRLVFLRPLVPAEEVYFSYRVELR